MSSLYLRRKIADKLALVLSLLAVVVGVSALLWILWTLFSNGFAALTLNFSLSPHRRRAQKGAGWRMPSWVAC